MKLINALGLLFQFKVFGLAAPGIIGDKGLKRMEIIFKTVMADFSIPVLSVLISGFTVASSVAVISRGLKASENGFTGAEMTWFFIMLIIMSVFYILLVLKFRKIRSWMDLHSSSPRYGNFFHNDGLRRNSLFAGAFLFTGGFPVQPVIISTMP